MSQWSIRGRFLIAIVSARVADGPEAQRGLAQFAFGRALDDGLEQHSHDKNQIGHHGRVSPHRTCPHENAELEKQAERLAKEIKRLGGTEKIV